MSLSLQAALGWYSNWLSKDYLPVDQAAGSTWYNNYYIVCVIMATVVMQGTFALHYFCNTAL